VLGKNALARGRKSLAAKIADLVSVSIRMSSSCISTNVLAADCASGGASVCEGVADAVKSSAAVTAFKRASVDSNVTAVGIHRIADRAVGVASLIVRVSKSGSLAANVADSAALSSGSGVVCKLAVSQLAANVAGSIAITCIGVSNCFALKLDAAVLTNGTANSLGSMCECIVSCAGGATLNIAGSIASSRVGMIADCLAAAGNYADAVAIQGIVVVADVIANSLADIADCVVVSVLVAGRLGSAASVALLCIAVAGPDVLLSSLISATVIADLIASVGVSVLGVCLSEAANKTSVAATEFIAVHAVGEQSRAAAVNAGNGALKLVCVRSIAGSAANVTSSGAGMQPSVNEISLSSQLAANVTRGVAAVGVGVNNAGSGLAADVASGRALSLVGVNQSGTCCITNVADGIAIAIVGMLDSFDFRVANIANRAVAGCAGVFNRYFSLNGDGTAVADLIAVGRVSVVDGAEAGSEREKRQSHSQKQEENSFHFSLQKIVF
jgi:hypothetical protein